MALSRDARLIDRARRGDDAAFEQLHARHQPSIFAFCRHLTGNLEDAEDAVQHTFLAAYRRLGESAETFEWRPWLFTVARNRCLTLLRARRGGHTLVDPDIATTFDGLALEVERRQELRDLVGDMGRLPEPQRAALVLSQLDALSYREIGSVLDVTPEKVKALVFQARSSLVSAREAREAPCFEIRHEIATARGPALRRRLLRRHVGQCEGCREFEVSVMRQRHDLGLLLPVAPSAGLAQAILGAIDRETAAAGGAGAAVTGGGAGAGIGGTLAAIGLPGVAKLAVVVAVVGGGASGAIAADLPERVGGAVPWHEAGDRVAVQEQGVDLALGSDERERELGSSDPTFTVPRRERGAGAGEGGERRGQDERALAAERDSPAPGSGEPPAPSQSDTGDGGSLPPGLAKRDELPPGLAKRDGALPPGLAKRGGPPGATPGKGNGGGNGNAGGNGNGVAGQGGAGQGGGGANGNGAGQGQGNGGGAQSGAGGQGNGGGNGNAGGNGNGGNGGQGSGNAGGQGQGNGGGSGNGNAGGNGNGGGNPH